MNKTKKIAMAVVATVMAGTMAIPLAACGPNGGNNGGGGGKGPALDTNLLALPDEYGVVDDVTGDVVYSSYNRASEVTLNLAVGHEKLITSTSFKVLGDEIVLPDGKTYSDGMLKPAWQALSNDLHIKFNDVWDGSKTSANLGAIKDTFSNVDIFTSDLSKIVEDTTTDFLNLAEYLDYMPHYTAFLNQNPVVYLSLLQDGMETEGTHAGEGQTLYIAPYFDGIDDIERYCLIRQDWAEKLLNGDTATTGSTAFNESCKQYVSGGTTLQYNGVQVQPYMGETGTISVESANADGSAKITIVKNYANVVAELQKENSALDTAYRAITGAAYTGTSGNIVAIQNAALAVNPAATGTQLVNLFRAYVDACYTKTATTGAESYYAADKRANLFNGYDACWDVDDLVAMLRCVKTNKAALGVKEGNDIGGITAREGNNNRTPDLLRLAGQLYGVRGTASASEYFYIDSNGDLQDARNDDEFYQAAINLNKLFQEGLILDATAGYTFAATGGIAETTDSKSKVPVECFMEYDYSQTQTQYGFYVQDDELSGAPASLNRYGSYNFAAIATPVSKWDVDGSGTISADEYFRFTESWRTTKTSGLAVNGAVRNNPEKLKAVLQFIDYLYSSDGQIVSTYGPMASDANGTDGFWYNTVATASDNYFKYKGVKYAGTSYKGRTTPTITTKVYNSFMDKEVNNWYVSSNSNVSKAKLSFTNYARYLIGSTLPLGVKDQSFESQLTSNMGKVGSDKVGVLLDLGVIKGMTLELDPENWWYTCVPSGLPVSDIYNSATWLGKDDYTSYKHFWGDEKESMGIMPWIVFYGTSSTYAGTTKVDSFAYTSIDDMLNHALDNGADTVKQLNTVREHANSEAWKTAKAYWEYLKPASSTEE